MAKKEKTFLVVYHMNAAAQRKTQAAMKKDPASMAEGMNAWMAWAKKCGSSLVDMGNPLGKGVKLSGKTATPSRRNVTGYSIIKAPTMAGAKKLLKGHPHLTWTPSGCDIEVHEVMPIGK